MLEPIYSMRGKLPPLHSIGKAKSIDEDDPPNVQDLSAESDRSFLLEVTRFDVSDAEDALRALRRSFRILYPSKNTCKRALDHSTISFVHCRNGVGLGKYYIQLQQVMERRVWLEFTRDYIFRIKSSMGYIHDLESMVHAEYCTWHDIMHNNSSKVVESKLCCLSSLCEDLRVHTSHWRSIKQRIQTNRWMQPLLSNFYAELETMKKAFCQLQDTAIWWIYKLIQIGLEVFAHSNTHQITNEMLWNVARGIENFNSIISSTTMQKRRFHKFSASSVFTKPRCCKLFSSSILSTFPFLVSSTVKPVPLADVLAKLANQRARYAALETHGFLTGSDDFLDILDLGGFPRFVWNEQSQNPLKTSQLETSDYHSATGSTTSLSAAILKIGSLRAPDLSILMSPLVDFARREQEFAEKFLTIVCNSTNFLRKGNGSQRTCQSLKENRGVLNLSRTPRGFSGTPVLSRTDSRRKTVSWGDTADTSLRTQLTSKYMDDLWEFFGHNLELLFYEPAWAGERNVMKSDLGTLHLVNDAVVMMLCRMIYHSILKDLFPVNSTLSLQDVARRLHIVAAMSSWDHCLCVAQGKKLVDKCYPCPLVNGDFSTKTGLFLRDTYQPLISALEECVRSLQDFDQGSEMCLPKLNLNLFQMLPVIRGLQTTSRVALSWCFTKTHQFLSAWSVSSFILVTQTDLKMLADETKRSVCLVQSFCSGTTHYTSPQDTHLHSSIVNIYHNLDDINSQLQSLSGSVMKLFAENCGKISRQFFQTNMPVGKMWRKKSSDYASEHQDYVEVALETILEPVVEGVSKLRVTSQLSVVSMATVAMCEAWTDFILKEKIKFSLHGAHQLGLDFNFVRTWLHSYISNEEVRQSVTELSIFSYLNGIVQLLRRQPKRRASSRFADPCSMDDINCDHPEAVESDRGKRGSVSIEYSSEPETSNEESDICSVPNTDDWLALRVYGGSRIWKFPSCFNIQRENS